MNTYFANNPRKYEVNDPRWKINDLLTREKDFAQTIHEKS